MNLYLSNGVSSLLCPKSCFLYKSDCAAFGTALEQIRRVFDDKNKDNFRQLSIKTCRRCLLESSRHKFLWRNINKIMINYPLIIIKYPPCLFHWTTLAI